MIHHKIIEYIIKYRAEDTCLLLRFITLLSIKYGAEDTFHLLACYTSSADAIIILAHVWARF